MLQVLSRLRVVFVVFFVVFFFFLAPRLGPPVSWERLGCLNSDPVCGDPADGLPVSSPITVERKEEDVFLFFSFFSPEKIMSSADPKSPPPPKKRIVFSLVL